MNLHSQTTDLTYGAYAKVLALLGPNALLIDMKSPDPNVPLDHCTLSGSLHPNCLPPHLTMVSQAMRQTTEGKGREEEGRHPSLWVAYEIS